EKPIPDRSARHPCHAQQIFRLHAERAVFGLVGGAVELEHRLAQLAIAACGSSAAFAMIAGPRIRSSRSSQASADSSANVTVRRSSESSAPLGANSSRMCSSVPQLTGSRSSGGGGGRNGAVTLNV